MGTDKGLIRYHGKPQREYLYDMLEGICEATFMSIRSGQLEEMDQDHRRIIDTDTFRGPFNGLSSAHQEFPGVAWLVLACDLPLIDGATLQLLVSAREPQRDATALATRESGLPEPLAAIWEPRALDKAPAYLEEAQSSCPRKYLLRSDTALVFPGQDLVLYNANSMEEYRQAREKLAAL